MRRLSSRTPKNTQPAHGSVEKPCPLWMITTATPVDEILAGSQTPRRCSQEQTKPGVSSSQLTASMCAVRCEASPKEERPRLKERLEKLHLIRNPSHAPLDVLEINIGTLRQWVVFQLRSEIVSKLAHRTLSALTSLGRTHASRMSTLVVSSPEAKVSLYLVNAVSSQQCSSVTINV